MIVLSLFDGISCGRVALERANITVTKYYASEIDRYATQISSKNYPDIERLGDVTGWQNWNIDWQAIDLIIGGSPCQGFSFAGKQLKFKDDRSKLVFTFIDIVKHCQTLNPHVKFLLENTPMESACKKHISRLLSVDPILIDSALVSAQERKRLYWCNWNVTTMPNDKGLVLKDILVDIPANWVVGILQRPRGKNKGGIYVDKSPTLTSNSWEQNNKLVQIGVTGQKGYRKDCAVYSINGKCPTLLANSGGNKEKKIGIICNVNPSGRGIGGRVASIHGKSPTLTTNKGEGSKIGNINDEKLWYRKAYPIECERLQTLPDNYTDCVCKTQRYKAIGNGWTVDIISHLLQYHNNPLHLSRQIELF